MMSFSRVWVPLLLFLSLVLVACNPASEPNTASISGGVFFDCNKDGECEEEDTGIANMCVRLYSGGCGEDMIQMHSTNEEGQFQFSALEAGEYCVVADFELLTCGYAGNHPTTSISRRVTLDNGMHAELEWFGFGDLSGKEAPSAEIND